MPEDEDYGFDLSTATLNQRRAIREFFQDAWQAGHTPTTECSTCVSTVQRIKNTVG